MTTYYIATDTDQTAIYGLGTTEQGAIDDAPSECADLTDLVAYPCTRRLHDYVEKNGGDVSWEWFVGNTGLLADLYM